MRQTFEVAPCLSMPEASITVPTVRGTIGVSYSGGDEFTMTIAVPAGTTARITLPHSDYKAILLNGKPVSINRLSALSKGTYIIRAVTGHSNL